MIFFLKVSVLLAASIQLASATVDYATAFANLQDSVVWPSPNSTAHDISSTFGPRQKSSCGGCYDFHRGIDIHGEIGDDVLSTFDGKVVKKTFYSSGGLTLVVEHAFPESVLLDPTKASTTRWYTLYMHLDESLVEEGDTVTAGQLIAKVGMTGSTVNPHLHHEVRIGSRCSLEWAVENPSSSCNRMNYDPNIHPLLVYPPSVVGSTSLASTVEQDMSFGFDDDGRVHLETPDDAANINKFVVSIKDSNNAVLLEHVLDFNLRLGYDATSTAALDTPDESKPFIEPQSFGYTSDYWETILVIPHEWANTVDGAIHVDMYDTWGELASQEILRNSI